ncbi:hypothetical protein BDP67DRAFT_570987 [Colletotrichum lupini]|nr:hypothetical protein BDP67DRAFT_570987 [Colletotrichum lupini]
MLGLFETFGQGIGIFGVAFMFACHSAPTGISGNQPFERYPALHVSITNVVSGLIPKAIETGKHCTNILSEVGHFLQARIKAIVVSLNATGRNLLPRGLAEIQQRFCTVRHPGHHISLRLSSSKLTLGIGSSANGTASGRKRLDIK